MSPETETAHDLLKLIRDLEVVRAAMVQRAAEIDTLAGEQGAPSSATASALAVALHHYYTAFESGLERSLRTIDGDSPRGEGSHAAILREAASPLPGVRTALVSPESVADWNELRRFRHFLRHAYAVTWDWSRLAAHAERVSRLHPSALADIDRTLSVARSMACAVSGT